MLRALANFAMNGRWQAAVTASLLAVAAIVLPPLNYLASGIIVLATLKVGPQEGLRVIGVGLAVFAVVAALVFNQVWLTMALLLSAWLPVYLVTLVLGYTRSLAKAMSAAAAIGIIFVLFMHLLIADQSLWWQERLMPFAQLLLSQDNWQIGRAETEEFFMVISSLMTGFLAAAITFNTIIALLIGRNWQAKLYDPGAFGREFTQMTLGKPLAMVTAVLMLLALTPLSESFRILTDCLPVLLVLFAFQGIAVAHHLIRRRQMSRGWLVAMYVLLVFMMPQMLSLLATFGVTEQWFNFRKLDKSTAG